MRRLTRLKIGAPQMLAITQYHIDTAISFYRLHNKSTRALRVLRRAMCARLRHAANLYNRRDTEALIAACKIVIAQRDACSTK